MHLDYVLCVICVNIVKSKTDNTITDEKKIGFELD